MNHYVCVCGGREFSDRKPMVEVIRFLHQFYGADLRVMHGDQRGADKMAGGIAEDLGIPVKPFPADWDHLGKAAGGIRNGQMVEYMEMCRRKQHTVQVVAFPGNDGTRDMIRRSIRAGIDVDPIGWTP